jgi:tRNA(fMet)-specific endonuclease VapC
MKPKFMLDTTMCIYLMKHHPPEVGQRFSQCYFGEVVISAISLAELEYGVACSGDNQARNTLALASLLEDLSVAPFERTAAKAYGPVRLAARERSKDAMNKMIAAHAIALDVTLITNNMADFTRYPGLLLDNWLDNH